MRKKNLKIKDTITMVDKVNAIEAIVNSAFDEDGSYTPYYVDIKKVEVIVDYFLEGIELADNEYTYEVAMNDKDVNKLVSRFFYNIEESDKATKENEKNAEYISIMNDVMANAGNKIEFIKQEVINCTYMKNEFYTNFNTMISNVNKAIENFSNLDLSRLDEDTITTALGIMNQLKDKELTPELITDVIKNAVNFEVPETEIYEGQRKHIEEQNTRIKEQEQEIIELRKWKRDNEVRNVLNDKK